MAFEPKEYVHKWQIAAGLEQRTFLLFCLEEILNEIRLREISSFVLYILISVVLWDIANLNLRNG